MQKEREREHARERASEKERDRREGGKNFASKLRSISSWSWLLLTRFKAFHVCKSIRKLSNREQSWLNFSIFLNTLNLLLHVTLLSYMIPAWAANGSLRSHYVNWFIIWKSHGLKIQSNAACLIWLAKRQKKKKLRKEKKKKKDENIPCSYCCESCITRPLINLFSF